MRARKDWGAIGARDLSLLRPQQGRRCLETGIRSFGGKGQFPAADILNRIDAPDRE